MIKKINILLIIIGIVFTACFKTEMPPALEYNGPKENITIAELQALHQLNANNPVVVTLIDTNLIFTGVVTSTDQYGSSYKEIFIQDGTGGISISINNTAYYLKYPIGQRVYVKAKGLYLGNYASGTRYGFYQLSQYGGEGGTQRISPAVEGRTIFRSGAPNPVKPKIITQESDIVTGVGGDYHTLVTLTNCYFDNAKAGAKYYDERFVLGGAANQPIKFNLGSGQVIARISAFNTFANDSLPKGNLNITGILTQFGTDKQFIICSINDVKCLENVVIEDLANFDMQSDPFNEGWTCEVLKGDKKWSYNSSYKNVFIQATTGNELESWFVSPKFNFSGKKNIELSFTYRLTVGTKDNFEVLYCIDGINWIDLGFMPQAGGIENGAVKLNDNIATNPNLQIAFKCKTTNVYPMAALFGITFKEN